MTRSEPSSPPERLAALRAAPPSPVGGGRAVPGGVWPPPRPADGAAVQGRGDPPADPLADPADPTADSPTVPLSLPAMSRSRAAGRVGRGAAVLRRLMPAGWQGARIDPGRPGATALALVAAGAAVVAAVGVWIERPTTEPIDGLPAVTVTAEQAPPSADGAGAAPPGGSAGTAAATATGAAGTGQPTVPLVVSVSGKVERPGLVEVPPGARVADVLEAAGGALPGTDLSTINLARQVADGEQVAVGVPPAPDSAPAGTGPPGSGGTADGPRSPIDLNVATTEQLEALPGVGPVMAGRILEWRAHNGRFVRVEQLREIEGIGEHRFAQLRELVKV